MEGRLNATVAAMVLLIASLAGCGDDARESNAPVQATNREPSETAGPSDADLPAADPARFDRRVRISDSPDWLAEGFGSLWVKRDNGAVERISPDGDVVATIDANIFQQPVCQGIGVSDTAVWACATGGTLIRVDPATNKFQAVDVPKVNEQGRLTSSGGLLWVLTGDGDRLEGLTDRGQVIETIDLGTFCTDTADSAADGLLWVVCSYDGLALRVDLEAGKVTGRVADLPNATSVSVAGDVWVGYGAGLARVEATSLEVLDTLPLEVLAVRATDHGVWVRGTADDFLTLVDAVTGELTTRLAALDLTSGGDVIELDGRLWATAVDDGLLVRLRR